MSRALRRLAAKDFHCPKCDAPAGVACCGSRGEERKSVHAPRWKAARHARIAVETPKEEFFRSKAWRAVRYQALGLHGGRCQCCGARPTLHAPLHVDHILPRSRFPKLALELSNLQVLCEDCNLAKGSHDTTDWRVA